MRHSKEKSNFSAFLQKDCVIDDCMRLDRNTEGYAAKNAARLSSHGIFHIFKSLPF